MENKEKEPMTVAEIAKASGKTPRMIYYIAKRLGRLPTIEEAKEERKKTGRPRKYF